jgi:hypothetical protein
MTDGAVVVVVQIDGHSQMDRTATAAVFFFFFL